MQIDLSKFKNTDKRDGVAVYQREVKTPQPANEDGSGYTSERNVMTAYRVGRHIIKVSKVSDKGWSVWEYESVDNGTNITQHCKGVNAHKAQRLGRMKASKLAT